MSDKQTLRPGSRRMPKDSLFYDRLVPLIVAMLGIGMVLILAVALAAVFGTIRF